MTNPLNKVSDRHKTTQLAVRAKHCTHSKYQPFSNK